MQNDVLLPKESEKTSPDEGGVTHQTITGRYERPFDTLSSDSRRSNSALQLVRQFHATPPIEVDGQMLDINELQPEAETGRPIVFVCGYYAEGSSFRAQMYDAALCGRRVLCFNSYHGIDLTSEFTEKYGERIQQLQTLDPDTDITPQLRKAAALIGLIEAKHLTQVDVMGHSEGAIVVTMAAFLRPDLFARKALLCPAGMMDRGNKRNVTIGKVLDELGVLKERALYPLQAIRETITTGTQSVRNRIGSLLGYETDQGALQPSILAALGGSNYRQIDPSYGESEKQDLTNLQLHWNRDWFEWALDQATYLDKLHRREYPGRKGASAREERVHAHLSAELSTLATRRLDRFLAYMNQHQNEYGDASHWILGAAHKDGLFPPKTLHKLGRQAGVKQFITIKNAPHNVQHFKPDLATAFVFRAFDIKKPAKLSRMLAPALSMD